MRQTKLDRLGREILDLSLAEDSIIRASERLGLAIMRRPDALPAAVLADDEALPE